MKRYVVKAEGEHRTFVEVLRKDSRGYTLRLRTEKRWGVEEAIHRMSTRLFESCLRTGYLMEIQAGAEERYA